MGAGLGTFSCPHAALYSKLNSLNMQLNNIINKLAVYRDHTTHHEQLNNKHAFLFVDIVRYEEQTVKKSHTNHKSDNINMLVKTSE